MKSLALLSRSLVATNPYTRGIW